MTSLTYQSNRIEYAYLKTSAPKSHAKRPECSMRERFLSGGVVRRTPEYRKDDDAEMHLHILIPGRAH